MDLYQGRMADTKEHDGLHLGAVVLVEGTGYGSMMSDGTEMPLPGLVTRVHPDDATTQDAGGRQVPWPGRRPFIDCVCVGVVRVPPDDPQEDGTVRAQVIVVEHVAWAEDIRTCGIELPDSGRPRAQYRLVASLAGVR